MADPFQNARAYYDVQFPSSGDSFLNAIANMKNAFQGLGFMDFIPLKPQAHSPADMKIMVRGRDASSYYNPLYAGDADKHVFFSSGDSPSMAAPSVNPRIDIVYLSPSGDIRVVTGTEAAVPTLPSLAPSGDTRIPICAIWHKKTATKIVNFQDKDSNSGDSYIYQDLRPFLRAAGLGGVTLNSGNMASITGDNGAGTGTTAARADHHHAGLHTTHVVGSGDLFGDIEIAGPGLQQGGNRLTINGRIPNKVVAQTNKSSVGTTQLGITAAPTTSDGDEITDLRINFPAPKSAGNLLHVTGLIHLANDATGVTNLSAAVFRDAGSTAIGMGTQTKLGGNGNDSIFQVQIDFYVGAGSTNPTSFSVRVGGNAAGNTTVNGLSGAQRGGNTLWSFLAVEEVFQ